MTAATGRPPRRKGWPVIGLVSKHSGEFLVAGVVHGSAQMRDQDPGDPEWSRVAFCVNAADPADAERVAQRHRADSDD